MRAGLGVALVGLVACVGCGREPEFSQEEAIAAIEKLGGKFGVDENNDVVIVDLNYNTQVTDADLVYLKGLTNLEVLNLDNANISDASLKHLEALTGLEELFLANTKVTDAGLEHLLLPLSSYT